MLLDAFSASSYLYFSMMPGKKETRLEDEDERGVRVRWMKSSFLRLSSVMDHLGLLQ